MSRPPVTLASGLAFLALSTLALSSVSSVSALALEAGSAPAAIVAQAAPARALTTPRWRRSAMRWGRTIV